MKCLRCKRDADDQPAAYYHMEFGMVCWPCLTKEEKSARDPNLPLMVRFKMNLHPNNRDFRLTQRAQAD